MAPEPDQLSLKVRQWLVLIGFLIIMMGLFGFLYAFVGVGIGHAHHSSHRHPAEGLMEFASVTLPLWLVAIGIGLTVTTTQRGLKVSALLVAPLLANFVVIAGAERRVRGEPGGWMPEMPDTPRGAVVVLPAPEPVSVAIPAIRNCTDQGGAAPSGGTNCPRVSDENSSSSEPIAAGTASEAMR